MISKKLNIYVIVVTYNAMPWIDFCMGSIKNSTIPVTGIVVDNVSSDETIKYIKSNYPEIIVLQQSENLGFGCANNIGIKYALDKGADYIYLLNQDAWFEKETLEKLVSLMQLHSDYGVLSPLQTNKKGTVLDRNFCHSIYRSEEIGCSLLSDSLLGNYNDIYEMPFFQAAHWFISRDCILKVGLFSSVFKHYGEDNNYLGRVHFFNFKTGIVPKIYGVHDRENRKDDNLASQAYFFVLQYLLKVSDVNIRGCQRIKAVIQYFIISFFFSIFIRFFFLLYEEKRKYFLFLPSLLKIYIDVKKNRKEFRLK